MLLLTVFLIIQPILTKCNQENIIKTKVIRGKFNQTMFVELNNSLEYIIDYRNDILQISDPLRIFVESQNVNTSAPALIVVRQKKEVTSWELPLIIPDGLHNQYYHKIARTLCYDTLGSPFNYINSSNEYRKIAPIVTISTMSEKNITVTISLESEYNFYLRPLQNYSTTISPSTPKYYYYGFPVDKTKENSVNFERVTLQVFSPNSNCMIVSLQNASCPVRELNEDVYFKSIWESVSRKGAITISKSNFPNGFFIVFVVKGDDFYCTGNNTISNGDHVKEVTFIIKPGITQSGIVSAILMTVGCIIFFYIIFGASLFYCNRGCHFGKPITFVNKMYALSITQEIEVENTTNPSISTVITEEINTEINLASERGFDVLNDAQLTREVILSKTNICVSDLSKKDEDYLTKKSYFYFWHVLTVALFYFLPVIQLVISYQKVSNLTGNQDLCYYNFMCAHPYGFFTDFNHIFSNIGYISLGFLFICITYRKERKHTETLCNVNYGVPPHYGMFYALGFALIMEGVLSGTYHICPNFSNFQFDTSFMYITAVLCMVKIYHTRHPDINAGAYSTFGVVGVTLLLGMIGVFESNDTFWYFFTVLHLILCFYLTVKIYYLGIFKFDRAMFLRIYRGALQDLRAGPVHVITPMYTSRMVLLVIGNLLNWCIAGYGLYSRRPFAIYLLNLFILNTAYYFIFYVVMKILYKEKLNISTLIYLVVALICCGAAMYCFRNKAISWTKTPAQSRYYNKECILMDFYDFHDIWHLLSAVGMFFMFMVLLTFDDDLSDKPRSEIPVF